MKRWLTCLFTLLTASAFTGSPLRGYTIPIIDLAYETNRQGICRAAQGKYATDGCLFISFRDTARETPIKGDWVAWVGRYEDIISGNEGQYRVRLMHNTDKWDCAYPGVEVLPEGTLVATTCGHWTTNQQPYIISVRLRLRELDERAAKISEQR